jgi:hypothetical protein
LESFATKVAICCSDSDGFHTHEDLTPHGLFCELAKEWIRIHGKVNGDNPTWNVDYDTREVAGYCFGGISSGEISLNYITQMFQQS